MNAAVKPDGAASAVFGKPDERELRDRMKRDLPADTFKPQTWRVVWFLPLQALIWGGLAVILLAGLPWYANLGLALVVGHSIGCQALLVPPEFWRKWHNVVPELVDPNNESRIFDLMPLQQEYSAANKTA